MDINELSNGEKVSLAGAAAAILGAFLPWISAGFISVSGIDGDGVFTLLFGVAVVALVVLRDWDRIDAIAVGILGVLTMLISGNIYLDLSGGMGAGIGLYLTLIGGIVLLVGAGLGYQESDSSGSGTGAF